ncbi:BrnT family toxin [Oceanispirochaeta sp. M1]|uniref:BrnT family toxin n=1 Tax=Oceanispirochaeta sp. M1 TaxID=2283433 RepID=UPI000E08F814|nr:BrnT family toxin [Oceanispirochaeta sp. M1]NPD75314.1 BrnT family toxin [Oceanispirochaeta sp. M1]RDG28837.1 BrnT family toxin [Oceanispirochaeta sp. M1]
MDHISFDWDEKKNNTNQKKHKIGFAEAQTCFYDPNALVIHDPDHSENEDRFIFRMGLSKSLRILVVCHCYREPGETVRIISARKATTTESQSYGG